MQHRPQKTIRRQYFKPQVTKVTEMSVVFP